jgi:integral membrane protein
MTTQPVLAPPPAARRSRDRWVGAFRVVAFVEALTWADLLGGRYVKHVADGTELGVRIFGAAHGGTFVGYLLLVAVVARRLRWPLRWTALAVLASVPPFMTAVFEVVAERRGRLDGPRTSG